MLNDDQRKLLRRHAALALRHERKVRAEERRLFPVALTARLGALGDRWHQLPAADGSAGQELVEFWQGEGAGLRAKLAAYDAEHRPALNPPLEPNVADTLPKVLEWIDRHLARAEIADYDTRRRAGQPQPAGAADDPPAADTPYLRDAYAQARHLLLRFGGLLPGLLDELPPPPMTPRGGLTDLRAWCLDATRRAGAGRPTITGPSRAAPAGRFGHTRDHLIVLGVLRTGGRLRLNQIVTAAGSFDNPPRRDRVRVVVGELVAHGYASRAGRNGGVVITAEGERLYDGHRAEASA